MERTLVILKPGCLQRGLVGEVISRFEKRGLKLVAMKMVQLDEEKKAAMVSNLLVVLCGNKEAQPIVNSGSIY